jgi:hypothetical protein
MGAAVGTVVGTTTGAKSEDVSGNVSGGFAIDPAYREVGVLGSASRWPFSVMVHCLSRGPNNDKCEELHTARAFSGGY